MKKYIYIFAFLPVFLFFNAGVSLAGNGIDSSIGEADDCTNISIDFKDADNLTSQERAELMNQVFTTSLTKYERCQNTRANNASASDGDSSTSAEQANTGPAEPSTSTASSQMSGTQRPMEEEASQTETDPLPVSNDPSEPSKGTRALANGKIPDDIPPADNDSILEEQIRQAAINETDPSIQTKLWNEYRKYKGLPIVRKP